MQIESICCYFLFPPSIAVRRARRWDDFKTSDAGRSIEAPLRRLCFAQMLCPGRDHLVMLDLAILGLPRTPRKVLGTGERAPAGFATVYSREPPVDQRSASPEREDRAVLLPLDIRAPP